MSNLKRNTPKDLTEKDLWDSPPLEANDSRRKPNLKPRERTESSNAIGCPPSSGDEPSLGKSLAERHNKLHNKFTQYLEICPMSDEEFEEINKEIAILIKN